jgi:Ni/Fe-hydrogenase subunit HybB-like protein
MARLAFQRLDDNSAGFWGLLALNAVVVAVGLGAAYHMESNGHIVTGMTNQVVWGMPHVFAVFLIVSASGALNLASISSVFGRLVYKPYARLSGVLAIALLVGGLAVLVLDLGRPERLVVAMTTYNFKSIFSWNIYLYTGFIAIVAGYLFVMMDRTASRSPRLGKTMGGLAFVWRLILTTGTGSIFGFLAARQAYDTAILAPLFISASLLYGLAFTVLVLVTMARETRSELMPAEMADRFRSLLILFSLTTLYFTALYHITKLYGAKYHGIEAFLLRDGGRYTLAFWLGQIGIGSALPLGILVAARGHAATSVASILFLIGGLAQMFVIIIGGQAYPLDLFPDMIVSSSFVDGAIAHYVPSPFEILLGISGVSIAMLITGIALKLMPFLPESVGEPS